MPASDEAQACIDWINSFQENSFIVKQLHELTDGVILFEILIDIDYNWFKVDSGVEPRVGEHWIIKKLNLQKLYELLHSYCLEKELHFERFPSINIGAIAQYNEESETLELCKLILFIAYRVQPQSLLALPEETQLVLNSIIDVYQNYENQITEKKEEGTIEELNLQIQQLKEKMNEKDNQLEAQSEEISELTRKYQTVEEQKQQLVVENTHLNDEIASLKHDLDETKAANDNTTLYNADDMLVDGDHPNTNNTQQIVQLEEEIKSLKQENKMKEKELDEMKHKYQSALQEHDSLYQKLNEIKSNDMLTIKELQKELDALKSSSSVHHKPESKEGMLYQKLLQENEYLEKQNINQKDLLIEREKTVYELRLMLSRLETSDGEAAKKQVVELQQERILINEALYTTKKKLEKAQAFIKEQDKMIKNAHSKDPFEEAVKALQNELKTREEEIMQLKKQMHEMELQTRREQRLMMSAWYNATRQHSIDLVNANK